MESRQLSLYGKPQIDWKRHFWNEDVIVHLHDEKPTFQKDKEQRPDHTTSQSEGPGGPDLKTQVLPTWTPASRSLPPSIESHKVSVAIQSAYKVQHGRLQWLTPVILDTQEAEIRMIVVWSQPRQIVHKTLSWKYHSHTHTHTHTHTKGWWSGWRWRPRDQAQYHQKQNLQKESFCLIPRTWMDLAYSMCWASKKFWELRNLHTHFPWSPLKVLTQVCAWVFKPLPTERRITK
jgi:hypothetical protein